MVSLERFRAEIKHRLLVEKQAHKQILDWLKDQGVVVHLRTLQRRCRLWGICRKKIVPVMPPKAKKAKAKGKCSTCGKKMNKESLAKHKARMHGKKTDRAKPDGVRFPRSIVNKTVASKTKKKSVDDISTNEAERDDIDDEISEAMNMEFCLQYGFDEELRSTILARNEAYKKQFHGYKIRSLRETLIYDTKQGQYLPVQQDKCVGIAGNDGQCAYSSARDESTTFLIKDGYSSGNMALRLKPRCILCDYFTEAARTKKFHDRALEELHKFGKCIVVRGCQQPVGKGEVMCHDHRKLMHSYTLKSRIKKPQDTKNRDLPARQWSSQEIFHHLASVEEKLPAIWCEVHERHKKNRGLWYIDTEWSGEVMVQIALVGPNGQCPLNAVINYGKSLQETLDEAEAAAKSDIRAAVTKSVLYKFYGANAVARNNYDFTTMEELANRLDAIKFSEAIVVEWSANYCDYRLLRNALRAIGRLDVLPEVQYRVSALHLMRSQLLKGLRSYALPSYYVAMCPDGKYKWRHHYAEVDATKLLEVMRPVFAICPSFTRMANVKVAGKVLRC